MILEHIKTKKSTNIIVAECSVEVITNSIDFYEHIIKNYMVCDIHTNSKVFIIECETFEEMVLYINCNFNILIEKCDKVTETFESRKIEDSFLVRIVRGDNKYIFYYNDNKCDIMEYIHSVFEFAVLSYLPSNCIILHSSLVERNGNAILFSGHSGAGKTTMALLSTRYGTMFVENEHVVIDLANELFLYKTSCDIRIKEDAIRGTKNIIDYDNITTTSGVKKYKSVAFAFLEFGENNVRRLSIIEAIKKILQNLVVTEMSKTKIVECLAEWLSSNKINVFDVHIKKGDYEYSAQAIKQIMEESVI